MAKDPSEQLVAAAHAVAADGERVLSHGRCWGVQLRGRIPLLFLGRRQYLLALTDRRLLVFARVRGGPAPADLVLGKRYDGFTLECVRRRYPLVQVIVHSTTGDRMVFEFRRDGRELADDLAARVPPAPFTSDAAEVALAAQPRKRFFWRR